MDLEAVLASWKEAANRWHERKDGILLVWFSGENFGYVSNQELQAPSQEAETSPISSTQTRGKSRRAVQTLLHHIEAVTRREAKGCLLPCLCFVPIMRQ